MGIVIGTDFDNTLVTYDAQLGQIAVEQGWLPDVPAGPKRTVRDRVRALEDGEAKWTLLQAIAYGRRIAEAPVAAGALAFLSRCREAGIPVHVISHKTRTAAADPSVELRRAAVEWMETHGVFGAETGLMPDRVHFEGSRGEKIERIRALGCTVYIDDLEETFADPAFPSGVERILIGSIDATAPGVVALRDWEAVAQHLFEDAADPGPAIAGLLGRAPRDVTPLRGGRNSRVHVAVTDEGPVIAKQYFRHPGEQRDRLSSEFDGLRFLRSAGIDVVPRPIAADPERAVALYEYVEGDPVRTEDVTLADIEEVVAFVGALRRAGTRNGSDALPLAAEACFSFAEVLRSVERRIEALAGAARTNATLAAFLRDELEPALADVARSSRKRAADIGIGYEDATPEAHRVPSPSDFGFHNVLRRRGDGKLVFLDLEYFGWDDAAKMISDFLLQPVVSLSDDARRRFLDGACAVFPSGDLLRARVDVVRPLFGLKWAAIFLNEFLPERALRRRFADSAFDPARTQRDQLVKSRDMVRRVLRGDEWSASVPAR